MIRTVIQRMRISEAFLLHLGIVSALILAFIVLGYFSVRGFSELLLALIGGVLFVLAAFRRSEVGVYAIVLAALFVRFSLPTGTQSRIVASLLLTALLTVLWLARMLIVEKRFSLRPVPANAPLLAFMAITVISYLWSNAFRDPLVMVWRTWPVVQFGALAVMLLLPAVFLLAANLLNDLRAIRILTGIFLGTGILVIIGDYLRLPLDFVQVRPLFPTWFVCLAYAQVLFNRKLPLAVKGVLLAAVAAWLYRVFFLQITWFAAWIPTMLAFLIISLSRSRWLLLALILVCTVYVVANLGSLKIAYETEDAISGVTRLDAYAHNWQITSQHWLFGVGPAGYAIYYMTYFPTEGMATHSNYIDVLSQTGIVGMIAFLGFYLALSLSTRQTLARVRGRFDFVHAFVVGTAGGLVGTVVATGLGDWILPFVYTQTIAGFDYALYTWLLLGSAQAVNHMLQRETNGGTL